MTFSSKRPGAVELREVRTRRPIQKAKSDCPNSACKFYVLSVLRLGPTHCKRPAKREDGEE
jgi:hypothetical protein